MMIGIAGYSRDFHDHYDCTKLSPIFRTA